MHNKKHTKATKDKISKKTKESLRKSVTKRANLIDSFVVVGYHKK